jgi:hypothetical protein
MFESGIEKTIIITAIVLWFAHCWYLNERLKHVHEKLDRVLEAFDGLRDYLYEIDPQFDDERQLLEDLHESLDTGSMSFSGMNHMELIEKKEQAGKRTLNTPFVR